MKRLERPELRESDVVWVHLRNSSELKRVILEDYEVEEAVASTTPIFQKELNGKPVFYNAKTGKKADSFEGAKEGDEKTSIVVVNRNMSYFKGIKLFYDNKVHKWCFVICRIYTGKMDNFKEAREWEEVRRVYLNEDGKTCLVNCARFYGSTYAYDLNRIKGNMNYTTKLFVETPFSAVKILGSYNSRNVALVDSPAVFYSKENDKNWCYDWRGELAPFREKYGDIVPMPGNCMAALDSPVSFFSLLSTKQAVKKKGKAQERLDELLSYELPDPGEIPEQFLNQEITFDTIINEFGKFQPVPKYAVIQRVGCEEPMCVIRTFFKSPSFDEPKEGGRIYVGKSEVVASRMLLDGSFMRQTLLDKTEHWNFYLKDFDKEVTKGTKLEYYSEIIPKIEDSMRGIVIWSFLKWPVTEQMYKTKLFRPLIKNVFRMAGKYTPLEILDSIMGKVDTNAKSIYRAVGLSRVQVEYLMPFIMDYMPLMTNYGITISSGIVFYMKSILKPGYNCVHLYEYNGWYKKHNQMEFIDISDIDEDTIKYFAGIIDSILDKKKKRKIKKMSRKPVSYYEYAKLDGAYIPLNLVAALIGNISVVYGWQTAEKIAPKVVEISKSEDVTFTNRYGQVVYGSPMTFLNDYIQMVKTLGTQTTMKPYFNTNEEIVEKHGMVTELINAKKNEVYMAAWNQRLNSGKWQKWEYDDGKEPFIVVAPQKPDDLAVEGMTLNHCVKYYIDKVVNGTTNIMFIRMKEKPETPFYTVEVSNGGKIEQVHGQQNCCASDYPGLSDFVKKWAKERKLTPNHYDKVR